MTDNERRNKKVGHLQFLNTALMAGMYSKERGGGVSGFSRLVIILVLCRMTQTLLFLILK